MKTVKTEATVFKRAIKNIEKYGWIQGSAGNRTEGYCLFGSIWAFPVDPAAYCSVINTLEEELKKRTRKRVVHIPAWNDARNRKKEHVVALLKACLEKATAKKCSKKGKK